MSDLILIGIWISCFLITGRILVGIERKFSKRFYPEMKIGDGFYCVVFLMSLFGPISVLISVIIGLMEGYISIPLLWKPFGFIGRKIWGE